MKNKKLFDEFYDYVQKNIIPFFSKEMCKKFEIYFGELNEWNNMVNLISFKNAADLIYRHFCDSLYSAKAIKNILTEYHYDEKCFKIADVGTGAGMPGIPVKIVLPNAKLTLIESITKKCKFLENVNAKLGLDVTILNERAEEIGQNPAYRQQYDFVLSRAVSKFSPNLEFAIPLLKINGYFIVHKTKQSAESLEEGIPSINNAIQNLGTKLEQTIFYNLPDHKLDYCILVFKKYNNTPANFPRRQGLPEKKPL
ncbi:MAG: 16S rRNA (guanine(527)-N(7))-methyltransferase RsmG [Endomicrobium sp.]|jgi:16S rRNA (guanine527-N7)-methyltransferase|nr:16S rRNA (guanine(527)-N(7))-methyltransferase RsmG [Endomicrobium sp.]